MITLFKGDCLVEMQKIADGSIDAIITDIPYGTTACKWDSVIDFILMWKQLNRIIKPNGAIVLFGSEPFSSALRMSNIKNYKYDWIWEKSRSGSAITAKHMPIKIHEIISVFERKGNKTQYNPILENGSPYSRKSKYNNENNHKFGISSNVETVNKGFRYPKSIRYEKQNWSKQQQQHPTQKPVSLMEYLIKTYTKETQTVLDFTMGSGTTGVACVNLNRNFIGIEKEDKYFEIAEKRIKEAEHKLF